MELWVGDPVSKQFTPVTPRAASSTSLSAGFATQAPTAATHELAWAPDGSRYVFASTGSTRDYDLYLEGGTAISAAPGADGGASFSPDGTSLLFTSARSGEGDLYLLSVADLTAPARRLSKTTVTSEVYATWHPQGMGLAWVAHGETGDHVFWSPALGDEPLQVTDARGSQTRPQFSPTGRWIAYYQSREDSGFDLMAVEPGSKPFRIAEKVVPDSSGPSWTPADELVFVQDIDEAFDPIAVAPVTAPETARMLDLPTVGHGDLDLGIRDGRVQLAYVAQGREGDARREFKKLYVVALD
ncbi:MAG: PD40 domain-containing protein [Proteobacteria bacterium]|nr:PD40 domain-containing protein [Pseudomonadota bacterium]